MADRRPVLSVDELLALDGPEMVEGYQDGRGGEPPPGDNRSRSYWHGWRVGAMDAGRIPIDADHAALVASAAPGGKVDPRLTARWEAAPPELEHRHA